MATDVIERLHYYQRQFLGAEDFAAQQAYHRDMRRRHNLGPHTWGIVTGLELIEKDREGDPGAKEVYVQPGMAVDGFGREIIVFHPHKLDPADFDAFTNLQHREVWIAFDEELTRRPAAGYEQCNVAEEFSRVLETFRIVVQPIPPPHDSVIVDGKEVGPPPPLNDGDLTIPPDESAPYQEFPDGTETIPRWLVRLGSVNWDGVNHKFVAAATERLIEGRSYVGVVAEQVLAPAKQLRIMPRVVSTDPLAPYDPDAAGFASVEGRLRVDGRIVAKKDVFLHGGKLSFQNTAGLDEGTPLWLQRRAGAGGAGNDLRIHIGDAAAATTRLTVGAGPADGSNEKVVLAVKGDDTVDIPTGMLDFGRQTRQMINLWTTVDAKHQYGIGVQANTTYFRSHNEFCWFKDGVHDDAQSSPGAGGSLQLRLDDQARLHFGAQTRQMLNLWQTVYGIGVQGFTLYFRSDADFCWFRDGAHSDTRSDPGGGALAMKLDDSSNLMVSGKITTNNDLILNGGKIDFREPGGGIDTDILWITRQRNSADRNDLRLIIGDNLDGGDRLVAGPIYHGDGLFKEQFIVKNNGDVIVNGNLFLGTTKIPVDVIVGEIFLNRTSSGSGTITFDLTSRLANVTTPNFMVALSEIRNRGTAVNARWSVRAGLVTPLSANSFRFTVNWRVDDIDGELLWFSYVAIFVP